MRVSEVIRLPLCTVCGWLAAEPLHDPRYGSHLFQAPAGSMVPVLEASGSDLPVSAFLPEPPVTEEIKKAFTTLNDGTKAIAEEHGVLYAYTNPPVPRYYVVYSAAGYIDLRYYFYRGEIETAEDIRRVIQCISETHLVKSPVPVNWKRIS